MDYHTQIQPLLNNSCISCHGGSGGLSLTSYENIMNGGNSGPAIIPFDHENSLLWVKVDSGNMPPNGSDLSTEEVELIANWIDEGAVAEAEYQMELNLMFQGEQNIIPSEATEKYPDMTSDEEGNIHLVWYAQNGSSGNVVYTHTNDGGESFTNAIQVNQHSGNIIAYPQAGPIIRNYNGILYVVYMDNRTGKTAI